MSEEYSIKCRYYDLDEDGNANGMWCLDPLLEDPPRPPKPLFKVRCPICGEEDRIYVRYIYVFKEFDSDDPRRQPYRCDVAIKCMRCKVATIIFGLHIPREVYEKTKARDRILKWTVLGHVKVNEVRT